MFENIIGHDDITAQLKKEIEENRLPHSILFFGESYGGKLTTAFELARILSCRNDGQWSCGCSSCRSHRLLESTNTVFLSSRDFEDELAACSDTLVNNPVPAARYLFYRAVRKITRQFDETIWKGQEQILKKISPELEKINEVLETVSPLRDKVSEKSAASSSKKIAASCRKISSTLKSDGISVNRIRNTAYWTHTTADSTAKIVIIDGADDLSEGARNAMLKILEEPPSNVFFILLSGSREGIIPTVLSRVRPYYFPERSREVQALVISRIFRETDASYGGLRDFFLSKSGVDRSRIREYAVRVAAIAVEGKKTGAAEMDEMIDYLSDKKIFIPFAEELTSVFRDIILGRSAFKKEVSVHTVSLWYNKLKEITVSRKLYNQSASLLLSSYFYELGMMRGSRTG